MQVSKGTRLYKGLPPGSESWSWKEAMNKKNSLKVMTVYNVVYPTLTAFIPDTTAANDTAVIIAPGWGFHFLAIDHEGTNIANWLVKKGFPVFENWYAAKRPVELYLFTKGSHGLV